MLSDAAWIHATALFDEGVCVGLEKSAQAISGAFASLLELPDTKRQRRQRKTLEASVLKLAETLPVPRQNPFVQSCLGRSIGAIKQSPGEAGVPVAAEEVGTCPPEECVLAHVVMPCGRRTWLIAAYYRTGELELSEGAQPEDGVWDEDAGLYWAPEGWYEVSEYVDERYPIDGDVTHFIRLPETLPEIP